MNRLSVSRPIAIVAILLSLSLNACEFFDPEQKLLPTVTTINASANLGDDTYKVQYVDENASYILKWRKLLFSAGNATIATEIFSFDNLERPVQVSFLNKEVGIVLTTRQNTLINNSNYVSTLRLTRDAGETWEIIYKSERSSPATNAYLISDSRILVFGPDEGLFRSSDAGKTWVQVLAPATGLIDEITFLNDNSGVLMTSAGYCIHTTDGGATWKQYASPSPGSRVRTAQMLDENTIYATFEGANGFFKSKNGGQTWTSNMTNDLSFGLAYFYFFPDGRGVLYTGQRILYVRNFGQTMNAILEIESEDNVDYVTALREYNNVVIIPSKTIYKVTMD